jgi:hypothetical protein
MKRLHRDGNPERYKEWAGKRGTLVNTVQSWMKVQGWEEDQEEEWKWAHEGLDMTIDLKESQGVQRRKEVMHKVREGWRWRNWVKIQDTKRRDANILQNEEYDEQMFTKAREAVQKNTRRLHLMAGAFMSPKVAAIAGNGEKFQD